MDTFLIALLYIVHNLQCCSDSACVHDSKILFVAPACTFSRLPTSRAVYGPTLRHITRVSALTVQSRLGRRGRSKPLKDPLNEIKHASSFGDSSIHLDSHLRRICSISSGLWGVPDMAYFLINFSRLQ